MATKTWTGTGTWDTTNGANWSGGTAPVAGDTIVFDGTSGTGVCTVGAAISGMTFASISCGAYGGTVDFSTSTGNLTLTSFSISGTGARTVNLGSWTFTLTGANGNLWDATTTTGMTSFNANTSTIAFSNTSPGNTRNFASGGLTYNTVSIGTWSNNIAVTFTGSPTIATFNVTAPIPCLKFTNGTTTTITNGFTWNGSVTSPIAFGSSSNGSAATLSLGGTCTINWGIINSITVTGVGSLTANNSFNLGSNTTVTINSPSLGTTGVIGS